MRNEFLNGLLQDLARRCITLKEWLSKLDNPEITDYAMSAYLRLEQTRRNCIQILDDPDFINSDFLVIYLRQYKRLKEDADLVESYIFPFVARYNQNDHKVTAICRALTTEVNWPLPAPLVGAFSSEYYWTIADCNTICVPSAEGTSLLGLGDLGHELGHILHLHKTTELEGEFANEMRNYIEEEKESVRLQQRSQDYFKVYENLYAIWLDSWLKEFLSDMVGTYLFGPAFGWQHIRLCASSQHQIFYPSLDEFASHPADEARLRGIVAVLKKLGCSEGALEVTEIWENYIGNFDSPPPGYQTCYPQFLIELLADNVINGCRQIQLRSFTESYNSENSNDLSIVSLVNQAWKFFLSEPHNYPNWEKMQVDFLSVQLGL